MSDKDKEIKALEDTIYQLQWWIDNEYWNPTLKLSHAGNVKALEEAKAKLVKLKASK